MEMEGKKEAEKENATENTKKWIDKAEAFIDDTAKKIHKSDTYREVDKSMEKVTKSLFRKAGKLWGKSEHYFKKEDKKKDTQ